MYNVFLLLLSLSLKAQGVSFYEATIYASLQLKESLTTFCVNENGSCQKWAQEGECDKNPGYMHISCREACGTCLLGGHADILLYGLRSARKLLPGIPLVRAQALRARIEEATQVVLAGRFRKEPKGVMDSVAQLLDEVLGSVSEPDAAIEVGGCLSEEAQTHVLNSTVRLANGAVMPRIGFGTWQLSGSSGVSTFEAAIAAGYRHFDTAQGYKNEAELGKAVKNSGLPREEFFLATKISSDSDLGKASLRALVARQLRDLQTNYIDLYMFHGFFGDAQKQRAAWEELEKMYDEGLLKALGVSNFDVAGLTHLLAYARVPPVIVQNKFSPFRVAGQTSQDAEKHVTKFAPEKNILIVGYSITNPWPYQLSLLHDPFVNSIANACKRTPAQIVHRWALQHGIAIIPRSSNHHRMRENLDLFDFELDLKAMQTIDGLNWLVASKNNVPVYSDFLGVSHSHDKNEL